MVSVPLIKLLLCVIQFIFKQGQVQILQSLKLIQFWKPCLRKTELPYFHLGWSEHIARASQDHGTGQCREGPQGFFLAHLPLSVAHGMPMTYNRHMSVPAAGFVCSSCRNRCLLTVLFLMAVIRLRKYTLDESSLWLAETHVPIYIYKW